MSKQDPNYHPNKFFIGLIEHKTFPYRETIQRQIKNRSEQQLIGAHRFEIEQFPKDSQIDTQYEMYLQSLETWLYDGEFWKTTTIYDAFNLFMDVARENTYFFRNFHKKNPKVKLVKYNGKNLPYPDENFDRIIISHCLEHILSPEEFLSEMMKKLKKCEKRTYVTFYQLKFIKSAP